MAALMNYLRRVKRLPGLDVQHARLRSSGGSTWKQFHCADSRSTSRLLGGQTKMVMIDGTFFFCTTLYPRSGPAHSRYYTSTVYSTSSCARAPWAACSVLCLLKSATSAATYFACHSATSALEGSATRGSFIGGPTTVTSSALSSGNTGPYLPQNNALGILYVLMAMRCRSHALMV